MTDALIFALIIVAVVLFKGEPSIAESLRQRVDIQLRCN